MLNGGKIPSVLHPITDKQTVIKYDFIEKNIKNVIHNLNSNKAYEHMISMYMLQICGKSIIKPLQILYEQCLEKGCFPDEWKKANNAPAHTKMTNSY